MQPLIDIENINQDRLLTHIHSICGQEGIEYLGLVVNGIVKIALLKFDGKNIPKISMEITLDEVNQEYLLFPELTPPELSLKTSDLSDDFYLIFYKEFHHFGVPSSISVVIKHKPKRDIEVKIDCKYVNKFTERIYLKMRITKDGVSFKSEGKSNG